MANISQGPNLQVVASAGNVVVEMDKVNKALDSISTVPLEKLRDTTEEAANKINVRVAGVVTNLEKLRSELANTGGTNNRLLKATEAEFARLEKLGTLTKSQAGKIGGAIAELKGESLDATISKDIQSLRQKAIEYNKVAAAAKASKIAEVDAALAARSQSVVARLKDREAIRERLFGDKTGGVDLSLPLPGSRGGQGGGGRNRKGIFEVLQDKIGSIPGIGNYGNNLLGGPGIAIGAALAAGNAAADVRQNQRNSGVSGSQFGSVVGGIQSLPIIKQLSEAAGEFGALFGLDTSTSDNQADLQAASAAAAQYERYRIGAKQAAIEEAAATKANAVILQNLAAANARLTIGGRAGQLFDIRQGESNALVGASQKRSGVRTSATAEIDRLTSEFTSSTSDLQKIATGRKGTSEGNAALLQLDKLRKLRDDAIEAQKAKIKQADAQFELESQGIRGTAKTQAQLASGEISDTAGIANQLESLDKQIRTTSGNPFEAIRKSFLELKPSAKDLAFFNIQLKNYEEAVDGAEKASRAFGATKSAKQFLETGSSLTGLNTSDRALQELINAGVTDQALIAKVKIQLETNEAVAAAKEVANQIAGIGDSTKAVLARNVKDRIAAEVEAESEARKRATGTGYTESEKAALRAAREGADVAGRAAATREAAKTPKQIAQEALDSLIGQSKFLTDAELRSGVGKTLGSYADATRTSRPEMLQAGTAALDQFLAVSSGSVVDASKPEIVLAKEANGLLTQIRDAAAKGQKTIRVNL